ncbi:MAG: nicotinate-nucleotide adenylyltransferase [Flavobacteriales bacterium]|nr:nicotinate-nucleotide adenylyltransferase [Flavobacteriales bacterium]
MKVGLYFGTYNPVHVGHLIIANHMANYTDLDQVWMVVTPRNPLKQKDSLLEDYHRLELVKRAIEGNWNLKVSDIEFQLEKPSYTASTLAHLQEKYPAHEFSLIMGEDNLRTLHKWKNFEYILKNHSVVVYPRVLTEQEKSEAIQPPIKPEVYNHPSVNMIDAPVMKVSASFIRRAIKEQKDVRYLLTEPVFKYVDEMNFYKS